MSVLISFQFSSFCIAKQVSVTDKYSIIVRNDPFDKDRGNADDAKGSGSEGKGDLQGIEDKYELHGVVRAGNIRKAYLKARKPDRKKKNKSRKNVSPFRTVVKGDMIDGWEVEKITDAGMLLARNGKFVTMKVFSSRKASRRTRTPVALLTKPPRTSSSATSVPKKVSSFPIHTNNKKSTPKAKSMLKAPVRPPNIPDNPFSRLLMQNRGNLKTGTPSAGKTGFPVPTAPRVNH